MSNSLFIYIPNADRLTLLSLPTETVTTKHLFGDYTEWDYCRLTFKTPEDCETAKAKLKDEKDVEFLYGRVS
jgi:hypothetical protein